MNDCDFLKPCPCLVDDVLAHFGSFGFTLDGLVMFVDHGIFLGFNLKMANKCSLKLTIIQTKHEELDMQTSHVSPCWSCLHANLEALRSTHSELLGSLASQPHFYIPLPFDIIRRTTNQLPESQSHTSHAGWKGRVANNNGAATCQSRAKATTASLHRAQPYTSIL